MKVLITGGAGFIGRRLAKTLCVQGEVTGASGKKEPVERVVLFDVAAGDAPLDDARIVSRTGDIGVPDEMSSLIAEGFDVVFHLAAIVSSNAEEDFDLGYRVNLAGTLNLLEACRRHGQVPRFVFTSSCACYGGELPAKIPDDWILTPQTSYGAQKAIGELLLADYTRKGFVDGRGVRLPTIVVRPGKPNKAASTFASSIIREPLSGKRAVCPVQPDSRMYILSPRRAVEALVLAAEVPTSLFGRVRSLTLPGIEVSIGELVEALDEAAGSDVRKLIDWKLDPKIQEIVSGWPVNFDAARARSLGFQADESALEIVSSYIEEELGIHL